MNVACEDIQKSDTKCSRIQVYSHVPSMFVYVSVKWQHAGMQKVQPIPTPYFVMTSGLGYILHS